MSPLLTGPVFARPPQTFDPDAYLASKQVEFDPDQYLREKRITDLAAHTSQGTSLGRGAAQGATLGFGDEVQGALQAAGQKVLPEGMGGIDYGKSLGTLYKESRDTARIENEAAKRANKKTYIAGDLLGSTAPTVALSGLSALAPRAMAVAQGAAQGAGYSDANTVRGVARDSLVGGGLGLAGNEAGSALSTAGASLASLARGKAAQALARAGTQATEEESGKLASLVGEYGAATQTGSRAIENLMRLEGSMTPEQRALYQQLQESGVIPNLQQQVAQSTLERLPGHAATIAEKRAAMQAAQQGLPQAIADRTAELSKPQILPDAASFAKSYLEPVVAATVAPPGMKTAAGIIFGRTRAGKALMARLTRPGNQIAAFNALGAAANAPNTTAGEFLRRALTGALPVAAAE